MKFCPPTADLGSWCEFGSSSFGGSAIWVVCLRVFVRVYVRWFDGSELGVLGVGFILLATVLTYGVSTDTFCASEALKSNDLASEIRG